MNPFRSLVLLLCGTLVLCSCERNEDKPASSSPVTDRISANQVTNASTTPGAAATITSTNFQGTYQGAINGTAATLTLFQAGAAVNGTLATPGQSANISGTVTSNTLSFNLPTANIPNCPANLTGIASLNGQTLTLSASGIATPTATNLLGSSNLIGTGQTGLANIGGTGTTLTVLPGSIGTGTQPGFVTGTGETTSTTGLATFPVGPGTPLTGTTATGAIGAPSGVTTTTGVSCSFAGQTTFTKTSDGVTGGVLRGF